MSYILDSDANEYASRESMDIPNETVENTDTVYDDRESTDIPNDFPEDVETLYDDTQSTEGTDAPDDFQEDTETLYEADEEIQGPDDFPEDINEPDSNGSVIDKIMNSDLSAEHKKELLQEYKDKLEEASSSDTGDYSAVQQEQNQELNELDGDSPMTLKRKLTEDVLAQRDEDTEAVLDNYRDNLRDYGVDENKIEEFVNSERDKMYKEYESLDAGDTSSDVYIPITDWDSIAQEMKNTEIGAETVELSETENAHDVSDISDWLGDINPNFDEFDPESPYCNNCGSCAFAVYNRLNGDTDMCATAENIGYNDEMNSLTGMEQVSMSPEEIESRLLSEGNGAHAIIGIDRAEGPGHWFNAACIDGKVVAIDGQTGEITDWPPDYGDVVNWEMSVKKGE